jgi:hypothetical protein
VYFDYWGVRKIFQAVPCSIFDEKWGAAVLGRRFQSIAVTNTNPGGIENESRDIIGPEKCHTEL